MAYPQGQGGGYPQYGAPPPQGQQYPPQAQPAQPGYGASPGPGDGQQGYPPPSQYNQQQYSYNQQQGYPPAQQPPYGAPAHSPYPQQQPYGVPPHAQAQQSQYGAPPSHGQYGAPQGQYGAPPPGQYAQTHQQAPYGAPPQAPYGAAPAQPYGAPQFHPTPPSPGYVAGQRAHYDATLHADELQTAMKNFGADEKVLIRILARLSPLEVPVVKETYRQRHRDDLEEKIKSKTRSYFQLALGSILLGPLQHDVQSIHEALKGVGTKESLLDDVLIGRSNADMHAIKQAYQQTYHRSLESDVRSDLSAKTERMYTMILAGTRQEDSAPVNPQSVDSDVTELHRATENRHGAEQLTVCFILSNRSDGQIRAIAHAYERKYRVPLEKVIKNDFAGHMEDALVQMIHCGTDRAMKDAVALEECMKGAGTKDTKLVGRVVRLHWDRAHMAQVRGAYQTKYHRDLVTRIKGETSGDYEKILVAMVS